MRVLVFDPGKINFAYALLDNGKVLHKGWIDPPTVVDDVGGWRSTVRFFFKKQKPDIIVVERYQYRGRQSVDSELINCITGLFAGVADELGIPMKLVMPAAWKPWTRRQGIVLEDLGDEDDDEHVKDAIAMGLYVLSLQG